MMNIIDYINLNLRAIAVCCEHLFDATIFS